MRNLNDHGGLQLPKLGGDRPRASLVRPDWLRLWLMQARTQASSFRPRLDLNLGDLNNQRAHVRPTFEKTINFSKP